jgi:hypothetical protein
MDLKKEESISVFIGDSSFLTCNVLPVFSPDVELIIASDALGKIHFLHSEKRD